MSQTKNSPARIFAAEGLMSTPEGYFAAAAGIILILFTPFFAQSDFWMLALSSAGIFALASVGLSLLTGYAGQVSLGHASFITIGGYVTAYLGAERGWPFLVYMLAAAAVGGLIGLLVGPFSLRFKGDYLVVATLALIFVVIHISENWESVTGGHNGISANAASLNIGPVDFKNLEILGKEFSRQQGIYYLSWIFVGIAALLARNLVRSRPGRALQAIRDRDLASEVIGVNNTRYKISVFVISSAIATMAGALYIAQIRFISPPDPLAELFLSIRFLAIVIVGGLGTIYGAIVGAVILGTLPTIIEEFVHYLDFNVPFFDRPLVSNLSTDKAIFSTSSFSQLIFGAALVALLIFQPFGFAGIVRKMQLRVRKLIFLLKSRNAGRPVSQS